jgi:hypothetical protein
LLIDDVFEYFPDGCSRAQVEASLFSQVHHADDVAVVDAFTVEFGYEVVLIGVGRRSD